MKAQQNGHILVRGNKTGYTAVAKPLPPKKCVFAPSAKLTVLTEPGIEEYPTVSTASLQKRRFVRISAYSDRKKWMCPGTRSGWCGSWQASTPASSETA